MEGKDMRRISATSLAIGGLGMAGLSAYADDQSIDFAAGAIEAISRPPTKND
jgi:hypothetical protein